MGVNSIQSTNPANLLYGEPVHEPGPKHPEPTADTIESAEPESTTAAEAKWTPPSQCARCWMCVKHRIADIWDWICSLFCISKPATEEQIKVVTKELEALSDKVMPEGELEERYKGVVAPSDNDVYRYLADSIEFLELSGELQNIAGRLDIPKKNLDKNQSLKNEDVLTERQLRALRRQLIEVVTRVGIFAHSDLPKNTTSAMIEKVKAYSLGKLTITVGGKTISLSDMSDKPKLQGELQRQADVLIKAIRAPNLKECDTQLAPLENPVVERYKKITLQDLGDESQAVHMLADCIEVLEVYDPLIMGRGDISKESLGKRIEMLKERLDPDQPVLGKETPEMRKRVKEYDFEHDKHNIVYQIGSTEQSKIRNRLIGVISAVQEPQEAPNEQK